MGGSNSYSEGLDKASKTNLLDKSGKKVPNLNFES